MSDSREVPVCTVRRMEKIRILRGEARGSIIESGLGLNKESDESFLSL